jgi:hypothetical protein
MLIMFLTLVGRATQIDIDILRQMGDVEEVRLDWSRD